MPPFESTLIGHNKGLRFWVWPDLDARENARERLCLVLFLLVYVVYFKPFWVLTLLVRVNTVVSLGAAYGLGLEPVVITSL